EILLVELVAPVAHRLHDAKDRSTARSPYARRSQILKARREESAALHLRADRCCQRRLRSKRATRERLNAGEPFPVVVTVSPPRAPERWKPRLRAAGYSRIRSYSILEHPARRDGAQGTSMTGKSLKSHVALNLLWSGFMSQLDPALSVRFFGV